MNKSIVRPLCVTLQNGDIIERPSGHRQIYLNGKITNDAPKLTLISSLMKWIFRRCVRPFLDETYEPRIRQYEGWSAWSGDSFVCYSTESKARKFQAFLLQ
jgi:hypothetical protein